MIKERLIGYIEQSIRKNWNIEALSNYKETGYSYKAIAEKILKMPVSGKNLASMEEAIKTCHLNVTPTGVRNPLS